MIDNKKLTKRILLFLVANMILIPLWKWAIWGADLSTVAGFIAASTAPIGTIVAGLAAKSITAAKQQNPPA